MNLYIGGRSQGKRDYCVSLPENEHAPVLAGQDMPADLRKYLQENPETCRAAEDGGTGRLIFDRLHLWVRTCLKAGKDPQAVFRAFAEETEGKGISIEIISDEIGNGVVPNDPFEREWRETVGRLLREIAAASGRVVRIVCGIPQVIKEADRSNLVQVVQNRPNLVQMVLIRHGAVKGNLEKRFVGITDESLTEEGAETIRKKKEAGVYPPADRIDLLLSSPLRRCLETAAIAFPGKEAVMLPDWSEIRFGEFEYGNYKELSGDTRYQEWIDSGGESAFPGGESKAEYCRRVRRGFQEVCEILRAAMPETKAGENGGVCMTAAAVVHLGTMKALLSALTDIGYFDVQAPNGEGYLLTVDPEKEAILTAEAFS